MNNNVNEEDLKCQESYNVYLRNFEPVERLDWSYVMSGDLRRRPIDNKSIVFSASIQTA